MPEEIKLNGGTPFGPVGRGVGCDDPEPEPVIPVPDAADNDGVVDVPVPCAPELVVRGTAGPADADDDELVLPLGAGGAAAAATTGPA
jgi:hypothetical protein